MKQNVRRSLMFAFALCAMVLMTAATRAAGPQDFTVVNKTGVQIHKLYVAPHSSDSWEENILGKDTLDANDSLDIEFHRTEKAKMWDLRVEDSKGNSLEWENLNLLEISEVTLFYKDGKAWATVK